MPGHSQACEQKIIMDTNRCQVKFNICKPKVVMSPSTKVKMSPVKGT